MDALGGRRRLSGFPGRGRGGRQRGAGAAGPRRVRLLSAALLPRRPDARLPRAGNEPGARHEPGAGDEPGGVAALDVGGRGVRPGIGGRHPGGRQRRPRLLRRPDRLHRHAGQRLHPAADWWAERRRRRLAAARVFRQRRRRRGPCPAGRRLQDRRERKPPAAEPRLRQLQFLRQRGPVAAGVRRRTGRPEPRNGRPGEDVRPGRIVLRRAAAGLAADRQQRGAGRRDGRHEPDLQARDHRRPADRQPAVGRHAADAAHRTEAVHRRREQPEFDAVPALRRLHLQCR